MSTSPQTRFPSRRWARWGVVLTSLQFKATTVVVVLTLTVTSAVAVYLLRWGGELDRQRHDQEVVAAASLLARASAPLLEANDLTTLRRLLDESADGQPLLYVEIVDADGSPIAVAEHAGASDLPLPHRYVPPQASLAGHPAVHADPRRDVVLMDVTYPITLKSDEVAEDLAPPRRLLGYVRTGIVANNWQRSMESRLDLVIGVGLLSLVAAIPFGFLLVRRIVGPLEGLAEAMNGFSEGRLDIRSHVHRRDEIGRLAGAFNQMADQHQQTHMRMARLNAELEERVAYRTQQLRELASRDPLTGLYNRRHFGEVLNRSFAEALRYRSDLSCMMIDLDDFKKANDIFGHQRGDELLQLATGTIVGQLRTADVAARYGGDEFILLLPQTDTERANILGERIVARFNAELAERFPEATVRMSVGIASLHSVDAADAETLIRLADRALYDAKARGKNRIVTAAAPAA